MLNRLRRLASQARRDRIHDLLQQSDPVAAARWRDATSDAGRYLLGLAKWDERIGYLLEREADVRSAIERDGFWEECVEWRIATESTNRVERDGDNYQVSTECDGTYVATVRSLPLALEACQVLFGLRRDLFYEVGWASWGEESVEDKTREPYLARISRRAVQAGGDGSTDAPITRTTVDWLDEPGHEVVVERGCLSMTCVSPTLERARQYAGIFEAVEADISRILGWC